MDKDSKERVIACDLDGTLAEYEKFEGPEAIGAPIQAMVDKVRQALEEGAEVWIFTARTSVGDNSAKDCIDSIKSLLAVSRWVEDVFGTLLPITHDKNRRFTEYWDDRGKEVIPNTGVFLQELIEASNDSNEEDGQIPQGTADLRPAHRPQPAR